MYFYHLRSLRGILVNFKSLGVFWSFYRFGLFWVIFFRFQVYFGHFLDFRVIWVIFCFVLGSILVIF